MSPSCLHAGQRHRLLLALALAATALPASSGGGGGAGSDVVTITRHNFAAYELAPLVSRRRRPNHQPTVVCARHRCMTVLSAPQMLLKFHAPWCPKCQQLAAPYASCAVELAASAPDLILAECDGTEEEELAKRHGACAEPCPPPPPARPH